MAKVKANTTTGRVLAPCRRRHITVQRIEPRSYPGKLFTIRILRMVRAIG